jgi:subtilisin family serine protease
LITLLLMRPLFLSARSDRVEIAATGEHFTTGLRDNNSTHEVSNGTSNAGPDVSGVAALVLSVRPALTMSELKNVLLESATVLSP